MSGGSPELGKGNSGWVASICILDLSIDCKFDSIYVYMCVYIYIYIYKGRVILWPFFV